MQVHRRSCHPRVDCRALAAADTRIQEIARETLADSDRLALLPTVTKYIRIGIGDKNDNPPYFDQAQYEAEVNEDEDIQHTVITVTAKDKDESSKIRYEITRGNTGGAFAVKNETGAIYVAGPLDYENRKEVSH